MKRILVLVGLVLAVAAVVGISQLWSTWKVEARTSKFNTDVDNLFAALQAYKENLGVYPIGNNAQIAKALKGENPKKLIILVGRKSDLNAKGEFVDPWNTALRIYFSDSGVLVRSAGPNRRFDDGTTVQSDDYIRSN
jgi:hypothetical protein